MTFAAVAPTLRRLSLLAVISLHAGAAHADPFHFQGIPLGQRALGFAGAFTGLADDPSAAYYNPAGLVWTGDSALSASLTLNAFDRQTITSGYRTPAGTRSLEHRSGPSLPSSVGFLKRIGRRRSNGERPHAIGLSTFAVDQRQLGFDVEARTPGSNDVATLSVDRSYRTGWQGISYAYKVSSRLSFGLTGFLSLTRNQYREQIIATQLGALTGVPGEFQAEGAHWSDVRVDANVKNLLTRFGVLYQVHEQVRLGLMIQPPCLHVRGQAQVRERRLDAEPGDSGTFFNASARGVAAHYPLPWEVRLGASYKPYAWLTLALDTSLYGRTGSAEKPVVAIGDRAPDPDTGAVPGVGHFELARWYRRTSGNVALGAEVILWDKVAVRAGFFTSLSAAPNVPARSDRYHAPDINRFGGALSVGIQAAGYDLSLGTTGLVGRGDALSYSPDDASAPYRRAEVRDATLFVFLTGMRNAISKLAKQAQEKLSQ